ncbi:vesicle-associated protein 2-2-like [Henckelia pumila]|uniref:vesicle-associated protein 2-2-like n=1 Tax=Henckelia pumila TaxID=405737 RepID=UPI003C6E5D93
MNPQLLEILPSELKFVFEVKKDISCGGHLTNVTEQYVAFKVKTTSPKKYGVRPNRGIVKPNSTCDFTVTKKAEKNAPPEMLCKDKFLIQSTVVPFGTTEEEIVPSMFVKESKKYVEETKIRVVLTSAPDSSQKLPCLGILKKEASRDTLSQKLNKKVGGTKMACNTESISAKIFPTKDEESKQVNDVELTKLLLPDDVEELKLKLSVLHFKLAKAECSIMTLLEENMRTVHEKETLRAELAISRKGWWKKCSSWFSSTICLHGHAD